MSPAKLASDKTIIYEEAPHDPKMGVRALQCNWLPKHTWVYGFDYIDEVVGVYSDEDYSGTAAYYGIVQDANYNVVGVVELEYYWSLWTQYRYEPYGKLAACEGMQADPDYFSTALVNLHYFQGLMYDRETGLYYSRARYYDPETGRFNSPDPNGQALVLMTALAPLASQWLPDSGVYCFDPRHPVADKT